MTFPEFPPLPRPHDEKAARAALLARIGLPLPVRSGYRTLYGGEPWFYLGDQLLRENRPEAALAAFEQAHAIEPQHAAIAHALAVVLSALKRPRAALDVLVRMPLSADVLALQASVLLDLGDPAAALERCGQALQLEPGNPAAGLNRGAALRALRRPRDALVNDAALAAAHPDLAMAHYNHGDALLAAGDFDAALMALQRCLALEPGHAAAQMACGLALAMQKRFAEAEKALATARARHPEAASAYLRNAALAAGLPADAEVPTEARIIYISWAMHAQTECDWRERAALEAIISAAFDGDDDKGLMPPCEPALAFNALLLDLPHRVQRAVARQVAVSAEEKSARWDICVAADAARRDAVRSRGRLRLGFLSPDFRPHPVAENHLRQLQLHDRSRFEVVAYSLYDPGDSEMRRSLIASCDRFYEVSQLPSEAIAQRIAADGIDILIDISGYTDQTRPEILAARPAPIQVQFCGTPGPAGAAFIDYRMTDRVITPMAESSGWDERLVWLPDTFWQLDETLAIADRPSRRACGLPEHGFVFCCFNTHQKFEPTSFAIWMRLLKATPGSVLWLLEGSAGSQANLCAEAGRHQVDPGRLLFAPRLALAEHLARHACADLFIDTFSYTAHTTAALSMLAGLPLLTCRGRTMASRIAASIVNAAGLPDMVVDSHADYEARARHLALNPDVLASIRARLAAGRAEAPLYRTERRIRQIESAFERMWADHVAGSEPASFEVDP